MRFFIFLPEEFSTDSLNLVNLSRTSDFLFRKKTQVNMENPSIKVSTYLEPRKEVVGMVPMISEWISPKILIARLSFP